MPNMKCPHCRGRKLEPERQIQCARCAGTGLVEDLQLSKHFRLSEVTRAEIADRRGLSNNPTERQLANLREACAVLDKVRDAVGPIRVNSGFRSAQVNTLIGGSPTTAHTEGLAIDFVSLQRSLRETVQWIVEHLAELEIDQVIYEGTWIHVGIRNRKGQTRRQALMMFGGKYEPLDLNDSRVV